MAKMILVADDNPTIRRILCRAFELEKDYDVCAEAENGQQAIQLALRHPYLPPKPNGPSTY
jgi:CheY-like chemotaxis protein